MPIRLNPQTRKQLRRFYEIKRGFYSFVILAILIVVVSLGELLVSNRALIVKHEGEYHFPTYGAFIPGTTFGFEYDYETNYRDLAARFAAEESSENWVLMPIIPYSPYEQDYLEDSYPPAQPSWERKHLLGTDKIARDIFARLFYGFRVAIYFAGLLMIVTYVVAVIIGCSMGYFGKLVDLLGQRLIEIWQVIPFLYVVILIAAIVRPNFWILLTVVAVFNWMGMTYFMRTSTYKEKARDYAQAARVLGAGTFRVIFRHILPNTVSTIITFVPFTVAAGIFALTALDFLGFGLPAPTPSWGELLKQGNEYLREAPWITFSTVTALVFILTLVTFIGEAVREAFDPKKFTYYR